MSAGSRAPLLLAVAGRDPTGGAGLDADREAARAFGVDALLVETADTDQDGRRVSAVRPRAPEDWLAEARAHLAAPRRPDAVKSGLLPGAEHVRALARLARELDAPLVVDPVLAASGGEPFLDAAGIAALVEELLPAGPVLTPNLPEAARLAGRDPRALASLATRVEVARELLAAGARAVLLKGGHGAEDPVRDLVLARDEEPRWHAHPRAAGRSLHGSGCRYAAAVAAGLAAGLDLFAAAERAGAWLAELVRERGR